MTEKQKLVVLETQNANLVIFCKTLWPAWSSCLNLTLNKSKISSRNRQPNRSRRIVIMKRTWNKSKSKKLPWPNQQRDQQWKYPQFLHCNQIESTTLVTATSLDAHIQMNNTRFYSIQGRLWPAVASHHTPPSSLGHFYSFNALSYRSNLVDLFRSC